MDLRIFKNTLLLVCIKRYFSYFFCYDNFFFIFAKSLGTIFVVILYNMSNKKFQNLIKYQCSFCDYNTVKKSQYERHLSH